jgi:hypothetical protein
VLSVVNFYDAASTALMTIVYCLALLAGDQAYIPQAENSRKVLGAMAPQVSDVGCGCECWATSAFFAEEIDP